MGIILKLLLGLLAIVGAQQNPDVTLNPNIKSEICKSQDFAIFDLQKPIADFLQKSYIFDNCDSKLLDQFNEYYKDHEYDRHDPNTLQMKKSNDDCRKKHQNRPYSSEEIYQATNDMINSYCNT